jgi:hypothetical protein
VDRWGPPGNSGCPVDLRSTTPSEVRSERWSARLPATARLLYLGESPDHAGQRSDIVGGAGDAEVRDLSLRPSRTTMTVAI